MRTSLKRNTELSPSTHAYLHQLHGWRRTTAGSSCPSHGRRRRRGLVRLRPPSPGRLSGWAHNVGGCPGSRPVRGRWPSRRAASAFGPEIRAAKTLVWSQNHHQRGESRPCWRWAGLMSPTAADHQREDEVLALVSYWNRRMDGLGFTPTHTHQHTHRLYSGAGGGKNLRLWASSC